MLSKTEVKYIQSLKLKKSREEERRFIAEGPKILADILTECPDDIVTLYATEEWLQVHPQVRQRVECKAVKDFELEKISALQTPQQVLALMRMPKNDFLPFAPNEWSLVLDGIQDPGNLGSIIRIADWFGIGAVYCTPDTADAYNPKVVQATMGSLWRVKLCYGPCAEWVQQSRLPVYGSLLQGENIFASAPQSPGIIIIGSEGKGIRPGLLEAVQHPLTIPRIGHAESLNAAIATGIVVGQLTKR